MRRREFMRIAMILASVFASVALFPGISWGAGF
jgi:hypothetical protein